MGGGGATGGLVAIAIIGIFALGIFSGLQRAIHDLGVGGTLFVAIGVLLTCAVYIGHHWGQRTVETTWNDEGGRTSTERPYLLEGMRPRVLVILILLSVIAIVYTQTLFDYYHQSYVPWTPS